MFQLNATNISIQLIDEFGNRIDPLQIREIDYLSRFIHKCVVGKIIRQMQADRRSGVIEVYPDKVMIREN